MLLKLGLGPLRTSKQSYLYKQRPKALPPYMEKSPSFKDGVYQNNR